MPGESIICLSSDHLQPTSLSRLAELEAEDMKNFPDPSCAPVRPRMSLAGTSTQSSSRVHPSFNDLMTGPSVPIA